jgi:DNA-binding response OmpR family regulator
MTQRIMFITDSAPSETLIAALQEHGFAVSIETRLTAATQGLLTPPDLIVLDLLDAYEGVERWKEIKTGSDFKTAPVLVLAEWGTGQAVLGLSSGADAFEPKPIDGRRLIAAVERCLRPRLVMAATAND